jgi:starch phosphorylase
MVNQLCHHVNTCNTLRLWKAEAAESFDFQAFNIGDYYGAADEEVASENLTEVLYPNDEPIAGKQLCLVPGAGAWVAWVAWVAWGSGHAK